MDLSDLGAPFPYPGAKRRVAAAIWSRLGNVDHYVEPFCGSAAALLARPDAHRWWEKAETVNDADCLLANFWRATQAAPEAVATWADWPVNEADLHARHLWLVNPGKQLAERVMWDPDYYDPQAAGWWVWGICSWIVGGWCSDEGGWTPERVGVNYLTNAGVRRKLPSVGDNAGKGLYAPSRHRYPTTVGPYGPEPPDTVAGAHQVITAMMTRLSARLRRVRVTCGDWSRVTTPGVIKSATFRVTGVLLDPPYGHDVRNSHLYAVEDGNAAQAAAEWAVVAGTDPHLRIAFCGYDNESHALKLEAAGWTAQRWQSKGGHAVRYDARGLENRARETVWYSPGCLHGDENTLF